VDVLEILEKQAVDLILMDIQMPLKNGVEATQEIRKTNTTLPILAMTANVMQDDIERYLACGMNDHIPKPFDKDDLFIKMLRFLDKEKILEHAVNALPQYAQTKLDETWAEKEDANEALSNLIDDTFLQSFTGGQADKMRKYL